jgi:hypothetical protein
MNDREKRGGHQQGEADICASTFGPGELSVEERALVYDPRVKERPGHRLEIWGRRENSGLFAWGFWGGVVAAAAAVALVLAYSSPARVPASTVVPLLATIIAGAVVYRLGPGSNLEERLLLEIDARHQVISWPTSDTKTLVALAFDDVESVAFEKIRFAVPGSKANTHIDAVSVYLVDASGRTLPVVEASSTQAEAHRVARLIAQVLKLELDYVGTGTGEWA